MSNAFVAGDLVRAQRWAGSSPATPLALDEPGYGIIVERSHRLGGHMLYKIFIEGRFLLFRENEMSILGAE